MELMTGEQFEPAAWFSPGEQAYYVMVGYAPIRYRCMPRVGLPRRQPDDFATSELPEDAVRVQGVPTQWAYDRVCDALKRERQRADDAEGLAAQVVERILRIIGGQWTFGPPPVDVAAQALINMVRAQQDQAEDGAVRLHTTTLNRPAPDWNDNSVTVRHELPEGLAIGQPGGPWPEPNAATMAVFDRLAHKIMDLLSADEQGYSIDTTESSVTRFWFDAADGEFEIQLTARPKQGSGG